MSRILLLLIISGLFIKCKHEERSANVNLLEADKTLDLKKISHKIIDLADLEEDEKVLLVMTPGPFDPIIEHLKSEIVATGATYLGALSVTSDQPESWSTEFTERCIGLQSGDLATILQEVDLGIMLPGANTGHLPYKVLQDLLVEGIRRTIHFHWAGAYDLNGNLLETTAEIGKFYEKVILETDYDQLAAMQKKFENAMRNAPIRVTTPTGTDISFNIGERPVTKQDGNASAVHMRNARNLIDREIEIPSGAIRVAPLEESVNGQIAFPDAQWNGRLVKDLLVTIARGKIIDVQASLNAEAAEEEMQKAGEGGRSFREFALGFNPLMTVQPEPEPWIPYYGYGAGVVRLSLGDNKELGGKVGGGYVRWNFFTDTTVTVGEDVWVDEGRLVK